MNEYYVTINIIGASGFQQWKVSASTPEEAKKIVIEGGGTFEGEDVEVQLGDATVELIEKEE